MSEQGSYKLKTSPHFTMIHPRPSFIHRIGKGFRKLTRSKSSEFQVLIRRKEQKVYVNVLDGGFIRFNSVTNVLDYEKCEFYCIPSTTKIKQFLSNDRVDLIHWLDPVTIEEGIYTLL